MIRLEIYGTGDETARQVLARLRGATVATPTDSEATVLWSGLHLTLLAEDLLGQKHLFPEGVLDQDLQQVDLRGRNSWRLLLAEVSSVELLEVQLINAVAPRASVGRFSTRARW